MEKIKIKQVVAGFMRNEKGEFLIAERPSNKPMSGFWEFPGGKVHEDEIPEIALIREFEEELGLSVALTDVSPLTFISHAYDDFHLVMLLYNIAPQDQAPKSLEDQELAWVNFENVRDYKLLPADLPLVDFLEKLTKK